MVKDIVLTAIRNYALGAMTGLVGWRLQLAKLFLKYAWPHASSAYDWCEKKVYLWAGVLKIEKQKKVDEQNAAEYEEALNDGATEDQLDDATSDLLNGRRN